MIRYITSVLEPFKISRKLNGITTTRPTNEPDIPIYYQQKYDIQVFSKGIISYC